MAINIVVKRQVGRTWGVFAINGLTQTLLEGGFFDKLAAEAARDEWRADQAASDAIRNNAKANGGAK